MVPRRGLPQAPPHNPNSTHFWFLVSLWEGTKAGAALPWLVFILEQCCRTVFPGEDGEGLLMQFKQLSPTPPPLFLSEWIPTASVCPASSLR